uniref:Protein TIC 40, chloroplastic n=1 Tax=Anthurium amnicola TaxID=1678845 RepID=A0A1D1XZ67_9ARAE
MESLSVASPKFFVLCPPNPCQVPRRSQPPPCLPAPARGRAGSSRIRFRVSAHGRGGGHSPSQRFSEDAGLQKAFACVSSSSNMETSSIGTPQFPVPPSTSPIGLPIFWIGVGVGLSALFSWVMTNLKNYAMKRAMNTLMEQMASGSTDRKNSGFPPSSAFPFPSAPFSSPTTTSPVPDTSQPVATIDVSPEVETTTVTEVRNETAETREGPKRYTFVDVSAEEILQKDTSINSNISEKPSYNKVSSNGSAVKQSQGSSEEQAQSLDALEKMMDDPTVQKMVYPYLPEEMRNPTSFKWMLQNPQYRQQLQDMLNSMGGGSEWDNRIMDSLKNFDLSSPEVKQQFEQVGLTPEEVISKIMANPEVAMAFQNPKVQAAIMDCSQNPFSIAKYQNDKEVMDVFNKISELFPGVTGPP